MLCNILYILISFIACNKSIACLLCVNWFILFVSSENKLISDQVFYLRFNLMLDQGTYWSLPHCLITTNYCNRQVHSFRYMLCIFMVLLMRFKCQVSISPQINISSILKERCLSLRWPNHYLGCLTKICLSGHLCVLEKHGHTYVQSVPLIVIIGERVARETALGEMSFIFIAAAKCQFYSDQFPSFISSEKLNERTRQ